MAWCNCLLVTSFSFQYAALKNYQDVTEQKSAQPKEDCLQQLIHRKE
jgi:hypothetical protein